MSALLFPDRKRNRCQRICIALIFSFMLCNLAGCGSGGKTETGEMTASFADTGEDAAEDISEAPEEPEEPDIPEIDFDELPEINTYDPELPVIDTMGFGMMPLGTEDYIAESAGDLKAFSDNGKMNYIAFKWITVQKAYENTEDMDCQCFVDLAFRDGSSVEGLRCNYISELKEGRKFRYGYVMCDSTGEDDGERMYLYLLQE